MTFKVLLLGVVLWLGGIALHSQQRPQDFGMKPAPPALVAKLRAALLEELRPVTLQNCELTRVGGQYDGGYLMCKNLLSGIQTAYSYGIGTDDYWDVRFQPPTKCRCTSTTASSLRRSRVPAPSSS